MLELILRPKREVDEKGLPYVLHYDPWLAAAGDGFIALADQMFEELPRPIITEGRKPRADAEERRKLCLRTVAANLVKATLSPSEYVGMAVPLGNGKLTRYDRGDFNADVLRLVIEEARQAGLVTVEKAIFKERRTVVAPTLYFLRLISDHGVSITDLYHLEGRETIELSAGSRRSGSKMPVDYADCKEADTLRAQMAEINGVLNGADIRLDNRECGPIQLLRKFRLETPEDAHTFDRHGRLYGGFWEGLPKDQRYRLTIGGEPVVDLDFMSMFVQLAYCRQGVEPPSGDLYAIPGLEEHRKAVKELMVSLFFRNQEARRLPNGGKGALPDKWNMARFKAAASQFHPAIIPLFDTNVGFEMMALESEILVGILLELASNGVAALPMHDGIMVAASQKELAVETMRSVSAAKAGRPLPVIEKPIQKPALNNSPLWCSRSLLQGVS
ncbi:hypothetical protein Rleg9DRAFT_3671 [Rhizobium leguminosarum bv. trifolii WSM597]|uniref:DNA polymerase I family protein with 3'-5'-exonuclease and polymerase domains n=1 Tax=Rhizobium leguminosarum bv. trifolii WSM597 TaxID=754764 RepID=I9NDL5_RHILT|nr:hypothetical protein [Rhizobium leguminosarum]EJB04812.1 hypothetical protein Rleg9DRAFT_3671 [Rhizobium leguminosarum bv. trifolii WSM597]